MFLHSSITQEIVLTSRTPRDRHPVHVYIASLVAASSRRVMTSALHNMAHVLTSGIVKNAELLQWHRLKPNDAATLRAALAERYRPATVNKMLSALRGVLRQCWRLGYMDAEQYLRAADIMSAHLIVSGRTMPCVDPHTSPHLRALGTYERSEVSE